MLNISLVASQYCLLKVNSGRRACRRRANDFNLIIITSPRRRRRCSFIIFFCSIRGALLIIYHCTERKKDKLDLNFSFVLKTSSWVIMFNLFLSEKLGDHKTMSGMYGLKFIWLTNPAVAVAAADGRRHLVCQTGVGPFKMLHLLLELCRTFSVSFET